MVVSGCLQKLQTSVFTHNKITLIIIKRFNINSTKYIYITISEKRQDRKSTQRHLFTQTASGTL